MKRPGHPAINSKSLREQVYEFLRQELQRGELIPGSAIDLNAISARLGISRTPLRDALLQLEVEGFVTISPRRGIFVNRLSLDEIRHYYDIAGALEGAVLASVFDRVGPAQTGRMLELNSALLCALERRSFQTYYELNIAFHDVFLALSDNELLRGILMPFKRRLYDFPRRGYIPEWELRNCGEHARLVACIERGDRDAAVTLWRDTHWSFTFQGDYIRRFYARAGDPTPEVRRNGQRPSRHGA